MCRTENKTISGFVLNRAATIVRQKKHLFVTVKGHSLI